MGLFGRKPDKDDPEIAAARAEAEGELRAGWQLVGDDREGFLIRGGASERQIRLNVWAAGAEGPDGEIEIGIACDKAGAYLALAERLRRDLDESASWAPPVEHAEAL